VAVVNGRMSPRSFRGYRRMRAFMARLLGKISLLAVQNEDYASRLRDLGAPAERIVVTGSVKYDGVHGDRANPRTQELARLFGIGPGERVWVAGSTQAPEEAVVLEIYRRLRADFPDLRLILVPRHRERFEEVAGLLAASGLPFVRRSALPDERRGSSPPSGGVILGDTMGELSAVWGLADVAFVGGSLGDRGGQNMIEPAAYGAAVTFGPNTWNFRETVERLLEQEAAVQVADAAALERETRRFLADVVARMELGRRARAFVLSQQGAVEHTLDALARVVPGLPGANRAAA
jgi:3-deoxy-D-manno-octulosonic-acid transferase